MTRRLLPLGFALAAAGCSADIGNDYAVSVTWLFNGLEPNQAVCDQYGVDRVRIRIKSRSHDRSLEAECTRQIRLSDGYMYGGFDSTFAFSYDETYAFEVAMLDRRGEVVTLNGSPLSYEDTFYVDDWSVSYYELRPLELFSPFGDLVDVRGSYTIDRAEASAESCAEFGIDRVVLDIASATDGEFADYQQLGAVSCEEGLILADSVSRGEYLFRYVAVADDDKIISEFVPFADNGQDAAIYTLDRPGSLDVQQVDLP